ncbi:MAG: hypothetical protein ACJ79R_20980 [Anaeromyxobacteraceae bacterium]
MEDSMKARAQNGRLLMDEPTDLPDGVEVEVEVVVGGDMSPEELARLQALLDESERDLAAGRSVPAEDVIAQLRARAKK